MPLALFRWTAHRLSVGARPLLRLPANAADGRHRFAEGEGTVHEIIQIQLDYSPTQVRVGTRTWNSGGTVARVVSQNRSPNGSDVALLKLDQAVPEQTELCLGGVPGKMACYGDSGGPSFRQVNGRWELTGATSRAGQGRHPCQSNTAAIYGSVPAHRQWIDQVTGGSGPGPGPNPCADVTPWQANVNYPPGAEVSYNGTKWQATWYTWGYPPGSAWGNWRSLGPC